MMIQDALGKYDGFDGWAIEVQHFGNAAWHLLDHRVWTIREEARVAKRELDTRAKDKTWLFGRPRWRVIKVKVSLKIERA